MTAPTEPTPLEVRRVGGTVRHVLADRVVREGDELELALADGSYMRGSYIWSHVAEAPAMLRARLAGPQAEDDRPVVYVQLPRAARVRWPR